jgi:hypothetical protein
VLRRVVCVLIVRVQADLAKVDRSATPWVFLSLHRPVYSADASEFDSHKPGAPLATWLEPILQQHRVDLVVQGHVHCAERTQAQFNGTVITAAVNEGPGTAANTYARWGVSARALGSMFVSI